MNIQKQYYFNEAASFGTNTSPHQAYKYENTDL